MFTVVIVNAVVFILVILIVCSVNLSSITLDKSTERLLYDIADDVSPPEDSALHGEVFEPGVEEQMEEQVSTENAESKQSVPKQTEDELDMESDFEDFDTELNLNSTTDRNVSPEPVTEVSSISKPIVSGKNKAKSNKIPVTNINEILSNLQSSDSNQTLQQESEKDPSKNVGMKFTNNDGDDYVDGESLLEDIFAEGGNP